MLRYFRYSFLRKLFIRLTAMILIVAPFLLSYPISVLAVDCGANFDNVGGVCVPKNTGLSDKSVVEVINTLMLWLIGIFSFIAIIAFLISGFQYLTAAGDEKQIDTAKNTMKYAAIGIVVGLSGYIVIKAISALLSGSSVF